jgi:hypothetical protein
MSGWWYNVDDPEPTNPDNFYITDFSSREMAGQDQTWRPPVRGWWAPIMLTGAPG